MKKQLGIVLMLLPLILIVSSLDAHASEGEISLKSQDGSNAECKAFSVFMPSLKYEILMTCRNITYPGNVDQFNYVVWADPTDDGNPRRLGTVGVGKANFSTNDPFKRIFVTKETNSQPRSPSGSTILSGNLTQIPFTNTPGTKPDTQLPQNTATPTPEPQRSTSIFSRLFSPSTILAFGGVVLLLVLVFILTRR